MNTDLERTREAYDAIFETARGLEYPEVDAFEQRMGYAIDRARLDAVARVLACPLKVHAPHWQHGRVIYAATHHYLTHRDERVSGLNILDVGTAKGFSAWCLLRAAQDYGHTPKLWSVDVIDPQERVKRNTVAELDGLKTLAETVAQWPEFWLVDFEQSTGIDWLKGHSERVHVAFIDGKHEGYVVRHEGKLLAQRQGPGDLAIFDDCQLPGVNQAVVSLEEFWNFDYFSAGPRDYAVGRRR